MTFTAPFTMVVNPRAGAGRAGRLLPRVLEALAVRGVFPAIRETRGPGHATELVREALQRGTAGIAVVGGDGTLSEATHGFFDGRRALAPSAWLAPLSCGTGGDFRKSIGSLNVSSRGEGIDALVARMLSATPRPIDVGHLRFVRRDGSEASRVFLNITSFGIGGLVDELVNDSPKWMGGGPAFLFGTVRALARYRPARVRVRLESGAWTEHTITNIAVANGRYFGGGMFVAPNAELDDGHFDVVTMESTPLLEAARLFPSLYRGEHVGARSVKCARARLVEAESIDGADVLLDVDGEALGRLPARLETLEKALLLRSG